MTSSIINETFVDIGTSFRSRAVSFIAGVASTLSRARRVGAIRVGVASAIIGQTLVDVDATRRPDTVSLVTRVADAVTGTLGGKRQVAAYIDI